MSCRCFLLLFILDSYHPDSLLAKINCTVIFLLPLTLDILSFNTFNVVLLLCVWFTMCQFIKYNFVT